MPRLKRSLPWLLEMREQVRGGIWHKSPVYDAARKVPPLPLGGRIRHRDIPHLELVDRKLLSKFEERHPGLAQYDEDGRPAGKGQPGVPGRPKLASAFVQQQLKELAADQSPDDAALAAEQWMVENGRQVLSSLDALPETVRAKLGTDPVLSLPPRQLFEGIMEQQVSLLRSTLAADIAGSAKKGAEMTPYRTWMSRKQIRSIQKRELRGRHGGQAGTFSGSIQQPAGDGPEQRPAAQAAAAEDR